MSVTPPSGRSPSGCTGDAFDAAFRIEPLRALDGRGRAEVRASGTLRQRDPGALIFLQGQPADTLFVLARGAVRLETPERGDLPAGRAVRAGELFGLEALVPFAQRSARAVAVEASSVLELPAGVLKRALIRAGLPELLVREEARARRVEWRELLGRTALAALPRTEIEALAEVLVEEPRERGEALAGDERDGAAWLVAGGLFELRAENDASRSSPPLYAARGDFIRLAGSRTRSGNPTAVALGTALALRLPPASLERVAARYPHVASAFERALSARETKQRRTLEAARRPATRHASDEMERLGSARSLLAIDLDRCTRCGHCTWACAETHGNARLERRGEKVVVTLRNAEFTSSAALLLPNACQHCREPACLDPCPTGAIRRDATGAVELYQDLCTGCGACAKACPWQAIRMAPRGAGASPRGMLAQGAEVAEKCDLCRTHDGPECVSACPTAAIFRLDPERDVVEVRAAMGAKAPPGQVVRRGPGSTGASVRAARPPALRALALLAVVPPVLALDRALPTGAGDGGRLAAGALAALLVLVLAAHALVKRVTSVRRRIRRALMGSGAVSAVAPLVTFHTLSGILALVCVFLHAGVRVPAGAAGALWLAFLVVATSGVVGALVYRFLPQRLTRIERKSSLPEDEPEEREALLDGLHASVSGANAAKKELVRRILLPYAAGWFGTLALVASGRTLAAEEAALDRRVKRALGGHESARLAGIQGLVRSAVEMQALRARRLLRLLLRTWLSVHLLGTALLLVLLVLHVVGALR